MGSQRNNTPGGSEHTTPAVTVDAVRRGSLRGLRPALDFAATVARVATWTAIGTLVLVLGAASLVPKFTEYRTLVITGRSMTETMPIGSAAVVAPIATRDVRVGDVISFDRPGASTEVVSHRVIQVLHVKGRPVFRTQGDHNAKPDAWKVDYVGQHGWKIVAHAPYVGRVLYAAQSHTARVVLIFVPVVALLLFALGSIWSHAPQADRSKATPREARRA